MSESPAVIGLIVPGYPHPLLKPQGNISWMNIRKAYEEVARQLEELKVERILYYSTQWFSILGHQIQAHPRPKWVHVDQEFHELGSIPYAFQGDVAFSQLYEQCGLKRKLHIRTTAYDGFPIDTGTIVANKLLNPQNLPISAISCNLYADRAETIVLGKAARDAIAQSGKRTAVIAVTSLSNRLHTKIVADQDDHVSSQMDDEWNYKILELLNEGRLEDVSQLARTFSHQAHADNKLKAIWWLAAVMGQNNRYQGAVHAYGPIYGSGSAVVSLLPVREAVGGHEFDEDDVDVFGGDKEVLQTTINAY